MLIECEGLTKMYGIVAGLNDVTISLEAGVHGLLGPNGSGKSTFLHLVTGQLRPTIGSIRLFGKNPWNNNEVRRRIGVCPEPDVMCPYLTGFAFVRFLLEIHGYSSSDAGTLARKALELTGMADAMNHRIGTYSRGMRQRMKLAQAIAHDADFIILDEPFNGLDPIGRHQMIELFKTLARQGKSILMATHILQEVEAVTDRFILIYSGRVLASGERDEIRSLLLDIPHTIHIRCDQPAILGRALFDGDTVEGIHIQEDNTIVSATTRHPKLLYGTLPRLVTQLGITVFEVHSPDDSLQTLFDYLLSKHRPT